jgi:hypothetical protein
VPAETILAGKIITEAQTRTFLILNIDTPFQERTTSERYHKWLESETTLNPRTYTLSDFH